jgi:hypothetical protein
MNPQLKQSWLAALRGGTYTQGFGHLRTATIDGVRHCAMGVLYELIGAPPLHPVLADPFMPEAVFAAVGVFGVQQRLIASLNDHGRTFEQIADIIERDLESEEELHATVERELTRISTSVIKATSLPPITTNAFLAAKKYFTPSFFGALTTHKTFEASMYSTLPVTV